MRFVKGASLWFGLLGALALGVVACEQNTKCEGGGCTSDFALTSCDAADQCDADFECAVFPCPADCADDANGRCDTCQAGPICLPQPPAECDPELCGPGQVCQRACSGACDLAVGQCYDVACQVACLPVGTPTEPPPDQACVTDFTDACLPPDYPVAARLDDVCAQQGLVLTDVSVAAECWPGAVQFKWTCCRGEGVPTPDDPDQPNCVRGGYNACLPPDAPIKERIAMECESQGLLLTDLRPTECGDGTLRWEWTCCGAGPVEPTPEPSCERWCDESGACYEKCCDPYTGQCWGTDPNQPPPSEYCVQGKSQECFPEGVDVKERAWADCSAQNLELRDIQMTGQCDDGSFWYTWTCCGGAVEPPPAPYCEKQCDESDPSGACYEVCCDPMTGQCWTNGPTEPQPTECRKDCTDDGTCYETCCDANGTCWTNGGDPDQPPPPCGKVCDSAGNCYESCCDAATGDCQPVEPPPPDPNACIGQMAGGDGTCTDLETLLAYASWTCAASGLILADNGPWGECDGGFQGLKFACCPQ